jgi:hypothetical protein
VTGDTEFLRLTLNTALRIGINTGSLVHALQNHDELTYELVHFSATQRDEHYEFGGEVLTGAELATRIRRDLSERLTGPDAPYNRRFTGNGIACTPASAIAAVLGISDLSSLTPGDIEQIARVHLLLAMFNAFQLGGSPFPDGISAGRSRSTRTR